MRVVLVQAVFAPVFAVLGEDGRPLRTFAPEKPWTVHFADLGGLVRAIEQFETEQTAGLAKAGEEEERDGETDSGAAQEAAEQGVRTAGGAEVSSK